MSKEISFQELEKLSIFPSSCKKSPSIKIDFSSLHNAMVVFDSTDCVDRFLDEHGGFPIEDESYEDDFESEDDKIPEEIQVDSQEENSTHPQPDTSIDTSEIVGQETIDKLAKVYQSISIISLSLSGVSTVFYRTLWSLIDSGSFDPLVFLAFLQDVAIFSELMLKNEGFENFPVIWSFFQYLSIEQVNAFERYMEAEDYTQAHELLWILSNTTDFQKNFLDECVEQTVEFKNLMGELTKSWRTMLDIQEGFIMKLIARLQASKAHQTVPTSQLPNFVEC